MQHHRSINPDQFLRWACKYMSRYNFPLPIEPSGLLQSYDLDALKAKQMCDLYNSVGILSFYFFRTEKHLKSKRSIT
jgi:hypothetical protein